MKYLVYDYFTTGEGRNICLLVTSRKDANEAFYRIFNLDPTKEYKTFEEFLEIYYRFIPPHLLEAIEKASLELSLEYSFNYG